MVRDYCCVSIPLELSCYKKVQKMMMDDAKPITCTLESNVKINQSLKGGIESVEYFMDNCISKKVFYCGSSIKKICYYKNKNLFLQEEYYEEQLVKKHSYNGDILVSTTSYKYNQKGKICEVKRLQKQDVYLVQYGYDDLGRINARKIFINDNLLIDQYYKFDILDRISEYIDGNQRIKVKKIDRNNRLISYTITDKIGNEIDVTNKFTDSGYLSTNVSLNGHLTTVCDTNYVDNVMLKKPYTDENDLDLIISNLMCNVNSENDITHTEQCDCISATESFGIQTRSLPISMRKRVLYNIVTNIT